MPRTGGKRNNAGRKKGVPNKRKAAEVEQAKELGLLPHEFLLAVSQNRLGDKVLLGYTMFGEPQYGIPDLKTRMRAAEAAAPYYAPRLATIEQKIESTVNHVIGTEVLSEEEFESKYELGLESPT
jgi:hypothetical protein